MLSRSTPVGKSIRTSLFPTFDFNFAIFIEFGNAVGEFAWKAIFLENFHEADRASLC